MAEKFEEIHDGLMFDDEQSLDTPYQFTAENQAKLAQIKELLHLKYPQSSVISSSPEDMGKYFFSSKKPKCTSNDDFIIIGQLSDDDCYILSQTQRLINASQDSPSIYQSQVSSEMLNSLVPLKQALAGLSNSGPEIELPKESLEAFVSSSPSRLPFICAVLEVDGITDVALASLCRAATKLDCELSFGWCVTFINCCLLNRVQYLDTTISRTLVIAIACLAQYFPRAVMEGLMIPCWNKYECFNDPQCDLLIRLFKENLSLEHQNMFLRKAFSDSGHWNESSVVLLSSILDNKYDMAVDTLDLLTTRLADSTNSLDSSLKFCKFLKEFISRFGPKFSQKHCNDLQKVLEENKTFLKRSCLTSLKKFYK